jgi:hypothetical protein
MDIHENIESKVYVCTIVLIVTFISLDDDVYLYKLQREGITNPILYTLPDQPKSQKYKKISMIIRNISLICIGIEGNLVGEGLVQGGILLISKKKGVVFVHNEKTGTYMFFICTNMYIYFQF